MVAALAGLSDDELTDGFDEAVVASRRAEWQRLAVEAEIDRRGMYAVDGTASLREWISVRCAEGDRAASHHATIARGLAAFPRLGEALADGRVSLGHVWWLLTLTRLTGLVDGELVLLGETHTVPQLEMACRAARRLSRRTDEQGRRRRYLRWRCDADGTLYLSGRLHGVDGLTVSAAVAAMAESIEVDPATGRPDPFDACCADALVAMCSGSASPAEVEVVIHAPLSALAAVDEHDRNRNDTTGRSAVGDSGVAGADVAGAGPDAAGADDAGAGPDAAGPGVADPGVADRGVADRGVADRGVADRGVADRGVADRGVAGADEAGPWDGFDLDDADPYGLRRSSAYPEHPGGGPMTWDGTAISPMALRRLVCDSRLRLTADDQDGRAVGIGRRSRTIPDWLAGQLRWRDGGCRFPGCARTRWLHGHHLVRWIDGGPTDLANLSLLCSRHHRAVHEGGWRVRGDPDAELVFTGPTGRIHISRPALRQPRARRPGRRRGSAGDGR